MSKIQKQQHNKQKEINKKIKIYLTQPNQNRIISLEMAIKIRSKHMMIQYQILDINRNKYRKMSKTNNMNNCIKRINKI